MFFIIAAILRIRNYIKRARHEQAMANRPKFRSCSVALRNPTQSMEQLRRDSLISKTSQQNSITTKGSNCSQTNGSSQENSSSSSPRHEPDTTPLLVITRPPGGTDYPTPTESHSSLQYMDDDSTAPKKKAIPPISLVKNGSIEGCYIVALKQAQIGHAPLAIMERGDSVKARPLMERGSSLKVRSSRPAVSVERRTSLKYNVPSSTKKDVSKSYKYNGGSVKRKLDGNGNPRFNGEAHIYQLVGSSEIIIADKNFYIEPRTNGSYEKSLRKTSKGYQIVSRNDLDDEAILELHSGKQNEHRLHKTEFTVESTREINCEDENGPETIDKKDRTASRKNLHREISETNREISEVEDNRKPENDELDLISPLTESSYFGLSQSDASLSSTTNQGNEFFGQTEYVCSGPHGSTDLSASNSVSDCAEGTLCPSYNHGYVKSPENIQDIRNFLYEHTAMNGESSAQGNPQTYNSNTNLSQTNADGSSSCADTDGVPRYNGLPQIASSANNSPSKAKHARREGELDNIDNENQSRKEIRNVGLINAIAIPDQLNGN
ncbi:uncharacterized protein LOC131957430 [Physella acuta]|uniref:uncharacterized protein LOC131957430 n=1 Tax=Physella acuta TaxID=109671 RepID=UPI0027DE0B93|nr:uncharacterized protein LOC131957430 [Physella acuta]